ncbi:hypothetical protein ABMA28_009711 [Loxostege sticticalis]|uniref:Uncharacterized protein n=1 Tax=Loxostege sticticalis TaxID=481309 RepID=A0ABD0SB79_LOXSC
MGDAPTKIVVRYSHSRRPMIRYPKDSEFWATDFFVRGCKTFLEKCPAVYKTQQICARNYNGDYKDFANYCDMQYENCNSWQMETVTWQTYRRTPLNKRAMINF